MESFSENAIPCSSSIDRAFRDSEQHLEEDALLAARLAEEEADRERNCVDDATLALILQKQFDLEYDGHLKKEEARLNGQSKVGVSLDRFRRTPSTSSTCQNVTYDSDDCETIEDKLGPAWDVFEQSELKQRGRVMGRAGFVLDEHGNMITKHDIPTSSRKNMCRLMELKTDIETGDAGATKDDFKITNYVYNHLKVHSKKSSRRASQRLFVKRERENNFSEDVQACRMNETTRSIIDGLLVAYKIEKLNGVIGHGKESTILHATGRDHEDNPGQEVAVKIFDFETNVSFKTRDTYTKSKCPSYKFDKLKSKKSSLNKWAERGFKNLKLLRSADINCPEAISLKKHVLVMTFLGSDAKPSPQLRNAALNEDQLRRSYEQVIGIMEKMYRVCELIHGDLSGYNLIWHDENVYVIDVSQSMFTSHPNANAFLYRDCKNILDFYRKSGLSDVLDEKTLFTLISGKDLADKDVELWAKIEDFPKNEKLMQRDESAMNKFGATDTFAPMLDSTNRADDEQPSEAAQEEAKEDA